MKPAFRMLYKTCAIAAGIEAQKGAKQDTNRIKMLIKECNLIKVNLLGLKKIKLMRIGKSKHYLRLSRKRFEALKKYRVDSVSKENMIIDVNNILKRNFSSHYVKIKKHVLYLLDRTLIRNKKYSKRYIKQAVFKTYKKGTHRKGYYSKANRMIRAQVKKEKKAAKQKKAKKQKKVKKKIKKVKKKKKKYKRSVGQKRMSKMLKSSFLG